MTEDKAQSLLDDIRLPGGLLGETVQPGMHLSINGIAAGLRNSG